MKAILMSIRPEWVAKILNGEKTIEIRKKFPKDYVGWVYIYATKQNDLFKSYIRMGYYTTRSNADDLEYNGKGKVVARFWCDKVEGAYNFYVEELCQLACINKEELYKYADGWYKTDDLLAIHITKLEIFDEPKEISEFYKLGFEKEYNQAVFCLKNNVRWKTEPDYVIEDYRLTRAPQSWCYVEV